MNHLGFARTVAKELLSNRTRRGLQLDFARMKARVRTLGRKNNPPPVDRLHFGAGNRRVAGWLNVDLAQSDWDVDLGTTLPWPDDSFACMVGQQVIEHLDLTQHLRPFLSELKRVGKPGAELWVSCPDMEKVCRAYLSDRGVALKQARLERFPGSVKDPDAPPQHIVNEFFHQNGAHINLFDLELLTWVLQGAGFVDIVRTDEQEFLAKFPEFPHRNDDDVALYVRASVPD